MRCWRSGLLVALALVALSGVAFAGGAQGRLPEDNAVPGWTRVSEPKNYTRKNLWEHIDGAAELLLSFGCTGAETVDYVKDGNAERMITVDIYTMGSALHSFGIFKSEQPQGAARLPIGGGCFSANGVVAFWKGGSYVKISALDKADAEAAEQFAQLMDKRIGGWSEMPPEFEALPTLNRVRGSERYIGKDALGQKALRNVIAADYKFDDAIVTVNLAALKLIDSKGGWRQLLQFERKYGQDTSKLAGVGEECFVAKDATYGELVAVRQGQLLAVVTSEKAPRNLLIALAKSTLRLPPEPPKAPATTAPASPKQKVG